MSFLYDGFILIRDCLIFLFIGFSKNRYEARLSSSMMDSSTGTEMYHAIWKSDVCCHRKPVVAGIPVDFRDFAGIQVECKEYSDRKYLHHHPLSCLLCVRVFPKRKREWPERVLSSLRLIRRSSCTAVHCGFLICASFEITPFEPPLKNVQELAKCKSLRK